jgi:hypothetical protein
MILDGPPARGLEMLGNVAHHFYRRKNRPRVLPVAFEGEGHELEALRYLLQYRRIPYAIWPPAEEKPTSEKGIAHSALTDIVGAIRRDARLPLSERLRLSGMLLADSFGRRQDQSWDDYWAKLQRINRLSEKEASYLRSLARASVGKAKLENAKPSALPEGGVILLPFLALPNLARFSAATYLGKKFLNPKSQELALHPLEMEALFRAGFPIPRAVDERARRKSALQSFLISHPRRRFLITPTPLPETEGRFKIRRLRDPVRAEPLPKGEIPWAPPPKLPLPARPFSASQLESYAQCPARYLYSNKLRLRRGVGTEDEYPLLLGQLVHSALERFFKKNPGARISSDEATAGLESGFREALHAMMPTIDENHPFQIILFEHFRRLVRPVPELESQIETLYGTTTRESFEKDFAITVNGLTLKGKIDRLDRTPEGALLVLDYKTGTVDFSPSHIAEGAHFQALVYWLAAEKLSEGKVAGVLFYDLKKGEIRRGIVEDRALQPGGKKVLTRGHVMNQEGIAKIKAAGLAQLEKLARAIREGDFNPRPDPGVCEYCDFPSFCRKGVGYV